MTIIVSLICFTASLVGGIVGIGGGVLIKPLLDLMGIMPVPTISFLSGLTVLSMAIISTLRNRRSNQLDPAIGLPLGIGAAIGGMGGKLLFDIVKQSASNHALVGGIQAIVLGIMVLGTMVYILLKLLIRSLHVKSRAATVFIGLFLGLASAFLGIGGGPMNLAVLYYFFSLDTKKAAVNSLLVIMISQTASLLFSIIMGTVPPFEWATLLSMAAAGALGGALASTLQRKISSRGLEKIVLIMLGAIFLICVYNAIRML